MDTLEKLDLLASDAQYDLACACGTDKASRRKRTADGARWIYPVQLQTGVTGLLFKTLLTNACSNDCAYCPLRGTASAQRCTLTPEETAKKFMETHRRMFLYGAFLTSGVPGTPDQAMERLIATSEILRKKERYRGMIHVKIIPGASDAAIEAALSYASTVSLNIEVPGARHFARLSQKKDFNEDIIRPLKLISQLTGKGQKYRRMQSTTQFIVGASDESDAEIVKYMDGLYNRLNFNRIYFSAYQRGLGDPSIPGEQGEFTLEQGRNNLTREHRLYQVDFLLRRYKFAAGELVFDGNGRLDLECDPKERWARSHPEFFPVRLNTAGKEELLRVPGLGPTFVNRVLELRAQHRIFGLHEIGMRGKLAQKALPYLTFC